jgi:dipeptidyl aminopeptidase/acylaminoacyl peptidase
MKLIDAGKSFSQFYYPRDDHSIGKDETRLHVQKLIMSHLRDQLTK